MSGATIRKQDEHTHLIGKTCKVTKWGVVLAKEYEQLLGIGSHTVTYRLEEYGQIGGRYEISLMFIDEPPERRNGVTFYCLKEIGPESSGDWHWLSLDQIIICENQLSI